MPQQAHGRLSPLARGGIIPGASIPARKTKGKFSWVRTGDWRITTIPATIPKAAWDAANHHQSICFSRMGFKIPRMEYKRPDHSAGAINPPSTIGCRANIGSIAPYKSPTSAVVRAFVLHSRNFESHPGK